MSEEYELSRLGAVPTKNSGRGKFQKGDGIINMNDNPMYTVDVKEYSKGYRITPDNWAKITSDAVANRTDPCLFLVLGETEPKTRVVAISEEMFLQMLEVYWMYEDLRK